MAEKSIRLGKAAGELNVGISTLIEFLDSKGIAIDSNPNAKLNSEHYQLLQNEFAADQTIKEQSKMTSVKREKRETISIRDTRQEDTKVELDEDEVDHSVLEQIKNTAPDIPASKEETPEKKEEKTEESKEEASTSKTIGEGEVQVQVVGKIDLDKINSKTRPDKKKVEKPKKEEPKAKKASKPKAEPKVEKPEKEIKKEVTETPKKEEEPTQESPEKVETIRVERKVLSGPTVLGKIDLPVDKAKSKPENNQQGERKKRKRIKKIDPVKAANQQSSNNNDKKSGNKNFNKNQGGKGKFVKPEIDEKDIQKEIKDTLARLSNKGGKSKSSKNRRLKREANTQKRIDEQELEQQQLSVLKLTEFVTVSELATMMNVQSTQVISACMSLGIFASINQRLDAETIQIVAEEFGFETEFVSAELQDAITVEEDQEGDLVARPPIITVMGHVDHGKTSLLDRIRNANVTAGEAGGITQHIGAYSLQLKDGRKLTFLDTPGHEAFTAMRARGAQVTDVAIIIVAADDDVMPQTKEAISHAQAAGVPMVFAINKIDKPGANTDKIKEQLSQMNILVEDWGGKYQCQEISAKQNLNIDALIDKVLLEAELLDLRANPKKRAVGTVIESSLDKGKGYVTNMLVEAGTMRVGDIILVGRYYGRVRAMHDEHGKAVKEAEPSRPVSVLGINGAPSAGDKFNVLTDEKEAKNVATKREQLHREQGLRTTKHITLDEIGRRLAIGDFKELNIIVKGDVDGSIEALSDSLQNLSTDEIAVRIVHKGVGAISEADVNLAVASDAIILGFQVRPSQAARRLADQEQIDIRLYSVIYKAIEEIKAAMEGMLSPDIEEQIIGVAEIRETFNITKVGTIAGCFVTEGLFKRSSKVRIIRDGIVIHTGVLGSLKRFKDDVKEVKHGYECGLNIDKFDGIQVGDNIEAFEEVEVARKL